MELWELRKWSLGLPKCGKAEKGPYGHCSNVKGMWQAQQGLEGAENTSVQRKKTPFLAQVRERVWAGLRHDLAMLKNLGFTSAYNQSESMVLSTF